MGRWEQVVVGGHPCDIYHPAEVNAHGYTVLYLHGVHLTTLHGQAAYLEQFERHGLRAVCPRTGRSWWTDRICPEFDRTLSAQRYLLEQILPYLGERWGIHPPRLGLLGTSMGGQGALRLAYKYPDRFPVVAAVSPAIDFHLKLKEGDEVLAEMYEDSEDARQDTAILHVHPLNWPRHQFFCCDPTDYRWWDSADRLRMKLASLGIPFEADLETSAGGHGFDYYNALAERAVGFVQRALERERLRV